MSVVGSIGLTVTPTSATIQQGGSTQVSGTVTRTSFTGDVAITVTGAPTGVTGTVTLAPVNGGNSAQVTLSAANSTPVGSYALTVVASGSGVTSASATFTLTITAATPASYTMALGTPTQSIAQGGNGPSTIAIARTAFTDNVTLTAENLPSGVTAAFATNPVPASSSTVTFTAAPTATPGTFNTILIRGTAAGLTDVTASVTLTITVSGSFTIAAGTNPINVVQGNQGTSTANVTRTGGFAGTIVYSVTGPSSAALPAGLTAAVTPTATADQNTLTVSTTSGLAVGTYPIVVHGTSFGLDQVASLNVVVTPIGNPVRLDYSQCSASTKPVWVAYQDGTGAFTRLTGSGDVYTFNVLSSKAAFATVTQNGGVSNTTVQYFVPAEAAGLTATCSAPASGKTINATVAGVSTGYVANVSMGGGAAVVNPPTTALQLFPVAAGLQDLVAYLRNVATGQAGATNDRLIIRRGLNVADGGSVAPVLDFSNPAEALFPTTVTVTAAGATNGNAISQNQSYLTGAACIPHVLYDKNGTTNSLFVYGVPAVNQLADDFYRLSVTEQVAPGSSRTIATSFHTLAARTVTMPGQIGTVVSIISSAQNSYRLLQAGVTLPADYVAVSITYSDTPGNVFTIFQSSGYVGGAGNVTLTAPDFGGVTGYQPSWGPSKGSAINFTVSALGGTALGAVCAEGATTKSAKVTGTFGLS